MEAAAPVTVEQAAAALGVSPSTVHRRIRSGTLRAEQAERPQGRVWLVHLPPGVAVAAEDLPPPTNPAAAAPTAVPAQAEAMMSLIQTTIGTVLGPLVGELAASRQTIERQAEQLVRAAETSGELRAQLEAARAQLEALTAPESSLAASTGAQSVEPTTDTRMARLRPLVPWVLMVLATVVTVALVVRPW